jgi:multiple sugar transport system permease protein
MAVALNTGIRGLGIYRVIYFMPVVTNIVAAAIVFQFLLDKNAGLITSWVWQFNEATGIPIQPPDFLGSSFWAKPSVVVLTVWKNVGFTMVIYLAGLQGVPEVLYDAAKVDGASAWQRFRHITIPMVSSTTFFLLVIQMIGAFQLFAEPFVMTRGGPAHATLSIVYYIYQNAFEFQKMGKASAIAWLLFGIIFIFTFIQLRLQRRWVHYEVEA